MKDVRGVLHRHWGREVRLSDIVVVDNSPHTYALNEDNSIPIVDWRGEEGDEALLALIPILDGLTVCDDVRSFLSLRNLEEDAL